jgi:hypothetical protein
MYKRETSEGAFVSYEVFAIKVKNDKEIYPEKHALSKWSWCPVQESRAEIYYNRINDGDVVIPDVDPETSQPVNVDEVPLAEVAETVSEPISEPVEISLVETVAHQEDPMVTETPTAEVEVGGTPDGGAVVTVAKIRKKRVEMVMNIPKGCFTQADFARANDLPERGIVWSKLDKLVTDGKLSKSMKQIGKGRPTAIYSESTPAVV